MTDTIRTTAHGSIICEGPDAVNVFRLASLKGMLGLEAKGLKFRMSALKAAKRTTGLRTNDRAVHIARLEKMIEEAHQKVDPTPYETSSGADPADTIRDSQVEAMRYKR